MGAAQPPPLLLPNSPAGLTAGHPVGRPISELAPWKTRDFCMHLVTKEAVIVLKSRVKPSAKRQEAMMVKEGRTQPPRPNPLPNFAWGSTQSPLHRGRGIKTQTFFVAFVEYIRHLF